MPKVILKKFLLQVCSEMTSNFQKIYGHTKFVHFSKKNKEKVGFLFATTILFEILYQNNQFLRSSEPLKIRLLQCSEVLWICNNCIVLHHWRLLSGPET